MQEIILIKNGELALKGLNRSSFESVLVKNINGLQCIILWQELQIIIV